MYLIGLDIGTSGLKAGIVDLHGNVVESVYQPKKYVSKSPGRMEQDIDEILTDTLEIVKDVIRKAKLEKIEIGGIAIDGQMGGIVGVDRELTSITGLDSNLDLQSERYNTWMHERFENLLARITCGSPLNGQKILKWKREYPEVYKKIDKFITLNGYVAGKIAGVKSENAFIDHTLLAFFGFENAKDLSWSEEVCGQLEVDKEKLPRVVSPCSIVGHVDKKYSDLCGLKQGTPVMAGAGDQSAGLLGMGVLEPGLTVVVFGSSTLLFMCADEIVPDLENKAVMYMPSVDKDFYYAFTYINGGGISLSWYMDTIIRGDASGDEEWHAGLANLAARIPPGSDGLLFFPYFGGRQCPFDVRFRGGWLGLNWGHRREHLYRAILEAVAYDSYLGFERIREQFPGAKIDEILATGGGAKNNLWNQIIADVFGKNIRRLKGFEYAIRGCGIIAACGCGAYRDLGSAVSGMCGGGGGDLFSPSTANNLTYKKYYGVFKNAVSGELRNTFHALSGAAARDHQE
jgi:xylulokinase